MIRRRVTVRGGPVAHPVNIRVHDSDLLSSLQKPGPSFPNPALAFPALPMHQPPPERDYGFYRQKISGEALSELGARPKLLPASIAPPCSCRRMTTYTRVTRTSVSRSWTERSLRWWGRPARAVSSERIRCTATRQRSYFYCISSAKEIRTI